MKKSIRVIFILVVALALLVTFLPVIGFCDDEPVEGCTAILSVGKASDGDITLSGQNQDVWPMVPSFAITLRVNQETGIKVIGIGTPSTINKELWFLNSHGVTFQSNARSVYKPGKGDVHKTLYGQAGCEILQKVRTAKEAIDLAEKIAQTTGVRTGGGGTRTFADKKEAYLIEGSGPGSMCKPNSGAPPCACQMMRSSL